MSFILDFHKYAYRLCFREKVIHANKKLAHFHSFNNSATQKYHFLREKKAQSDNNSIFV